MKALFDLKPFLNKTTRVNSISVSQDEDMLFWSFDFSAGNGFSRKAVPGWNVPEIPFQPLAINLSTFASHAGRSLTGEEVDWLMFALYVYSADRFACRQPKVGNGASLWRRKISIIVPVSNPKLWNKAKASVLSALSFVTDDEWKIRFVPRFERLPEEDQRLFPVRERMTPDWVCLYSGGLDSLAGVGHLTQSFGNNGLLVSGWTNNRLHLAQSESIAQIRKWKGGSPSWLPVGYGFPKIFDGGAMESSQRSRGWIHLAFGLAAAEMGGVSTLDVCENGIGALNLPTELSQIGSHSSRSVHPVFLKRIAVAAGIIFRGHFNVRQVALFETKGQLVSRVFGKGCPNFVSSFSCEIFPNYRSKKDQCGICPSCLVRRASLHHAGIEDVGEAYTWDVLRQGVPPKKQLGLIKMEAYSRRLRGCLSPGLGKDDLLWEYPDASRFFEESAKSLDLSLDEFLKEITSLHSDFVKEWDSFALSIPGLRKMEKIAA